jgi:hypothetical protein
MFAVAFPGGSAGVELGTGLGDREGSEFGTFKRLLRHAGDLLPRADSSGRSKKLAIPRVRQIFLSLILKNLQGQRFKLVFQRVAEKLQNFCFERLNHLSGSMSCAGYRIAGFKAIRASAARISSNDDQPVSSMA